MQMARRVFRGRTHYPLGTRERRKTHADVRKFLDYIRALRAVDETGSGLPEEDSLYAVIIELVGQSCAVAAEPRNMTLGELAKKGRHKERYDGKVFDSFAISAYERAIETLHEAGLVQIDEGGGRITARVKPATYALLARAEIDRRRARQEEVRRLYEVSFDAKVARIAELYGLTEDEVLRIRLAVSQNQPSPPPSIPACEASS